MGHTTDSSQCIRGMHAIINLSRKWYQCEVPFKLPPPPPPLFSLTKSAENSHAVLLPAMLVSSSMFGAVGLYGRQPADMG